MLFLNLFNFCIKPKWYYVLQDVLLKCFTLVFLRVYSHIKSTSQWDENIMILSIFPRGSILWIPPPQPGGRPEILFLLLITWQSMLWYRYCPICALLNQFWSPLSTSISISFRLNTSDSLLALETFSKEDTFIYGPFRPKKFLYPVTRHVNVYPQVHVYPQNVFVSFFSSSDMHQSHHLDGCQATGKSCPFIEAFWPFRFL